KLGTRAKKSRRAIEDAVSGARLSVMDALEETAPRMTAGYTVRREGPEVGRNDPCPCGSGKKYKKCCALEAAPSSPSAVVDTPRIDESTLHPEQARTLR